MLWLQGERVGRVDSCWIVCSFSDNGFFCGVGFFCDDFFCGSGTTAHAVLEGNAEEGARRRFLVMQLDEDLPDGSDAAKMGLATIADLARERIKRAIAALPPAQDDEPRAVRHAVVIPSP